MYKKVQTISYILFKYGNFSKPFLNLILEEKLPREWYYYFVAQKYKWSQDYDLALQYVDKALKLFKDNLTLYYILLSDKVNFLRFLGDKSAEVILEDIRKNFSKVPILARKIIAPILYDYYLKRSYEGRSSKIRFWSKEYLKDPSTYIFILWNRANMEIRKNNIRTAIKLYFEGAKKALEIPHPTGILSNLNNASWYLKDIHPIFSLNISKKACYYLGCFREDMEGRFYILDTLLEIQKIVKDEDMWETVEMICLLYDDLPEKGGWGTKEHYKNLFDFCNAKRINFDISSYENTKELRDYLINIGKDMKLYELSDFLGISKPNLSKILKGWTFKIRSETIRSIIERINLKVDYINDPYPIVNEYVKLKINTEFLQNKEKLKEISKEERKILFISTYMSLIKRDRYKSNINLKELFLLFVNDIDLFIQKAEKNMFIMWFTNKIIGKSHPILEGRKDLAVKFFRVLPIKKRDKFIDYYLNLDEKDRILIDEFIRNYVRYDGKWGISFSKSILKNFIQEFRLKPLPTILSVYSLDKKKERKRLVNILDKIVL
uniref:HTH cro/C1-type domain-containing protein n=1 Tax=Dictyoglomus turgidum TaxID=513050 RepID=A0A7C3SRN0_9BACT